jgi:hypothetical protein
MTIYPREALISALKVANKPVAYLVGSPFSCAPDGKGVPNISQMLDLVREVVEEEQPLEIANFEKEIAGKTGDQAYQLAMGWLQAYVNQDAVNTVVRRAVLQSCLDISAVGDPGNPSTDGDPVHWYFPPGTKSLATLVSSSNLSYQGPILTTNFDPLLSVAIRAAGKRPNRRVLDADGSLPRDIENEADERSVLHLHGYWRSSDTLHTPTQLKSTRPKLKASLQRLLRKHLLVVVAYGGWDDVFTNALADLLHDDQAELDVLWCFHEMDSEVILGKNKQLLESVAPAIARGRFRGYRGIDCHTIFSDLNSAMGFTTSIISSRSSPAKIEECGLNPKEPTQMKLTQEDDFVYNYLSKQLEDALESFSSQPKVWVDPIIANCAEVAKNAESALKVSLADLLQSTKPVIIKAPPQFGLTCLAHYLVKEAWRTLGKSLWLYLDAKKLNSSISSIEKAIKADLKLFRCEASDVNCVIVDSWDNQEKHSQTILQNICNYFKTSRIIVMQTTDNKHLFRNAEIKITLDFEVLYLWSLPRGHVRKVVADYNTSKHIGEEDSVTSKVVADLEVLNLHRTPMNCMLLLKVSEVYFDESPVNRTEMINRVLYILFNVDGIPTYKVKPDLKDCEFVLGYFCEILIRSNNYCFTRETFLEQLEQCCKNSLIDLDIHIVFDVLNFNHILVKQGDLFCFRYSYWIYYFAAQRMHHDQNFAKYIFSDKRYANYPVMIEFYTGIDRRREDALKILIDDVRATCDRVQDQTGINESINPFRLARWSITPEILDNMKNEIADEVVNSNLPTSIKDSYADQTYDRTRPYYQEIRDILAEYSFEYMTQTMRAGARALRNSDYVKPEIKRQLLKEIMRCWEQVTNVIIIILPLLAQDGRATFDGSGFFLSTNFGDTPEERFHNILDALPLNVVNWFKDDIFSQKMGPLLMDHLKNENNDILKHELILLLTYQRPRGWKEVVMQYIVAVNKNSFYLYDLYCTLRSEYMYGYASKHDLNEIKHLIQMSIAKHETGSKMPTMNVIQKFKNAVPKRELLCDE